LEDCARVVVGHRARRLRQPRAKAVAPWGEWPPPGQPSLGLVVGCSADLRLTLGQAQYGGFHSAIRLNAGSHGARWKGVRRVRFGLDGAAAVLQPIRSEEHTS